MTYAEYMDSPQWLRLKGDAFKQLGMACNVCGDQDYLEVHHKRYPRGWRLDCVANLEILCADHHDQRHVNTRMGTTGAVHISEIIPGALRQLLGGAT